MDSRLYRFLVFIAISLLIYLAIAFSLIYFPFERKIPQEGLDFDVLETSNMPRESTEGQYYNARDETPLFYRQISGTSDIGIILIHGSGSEGRYLITLAERINKKSAATVIIPDLRGHGHSKGVRPGDVNYIGQLEHDVEDLLIHLKTNQQISTALIGGHSSGGGLAVKYSGNNLAQFDGAILLAPYLGYKAPTVRPNSGGWVQVHERRYAGLAMLNNLGITFFNHLPVLFFNRPEKVSDDWQVASYSYRLNQSLSPTQYKADLANNNKPGLLLVGEFDEAFHPDAFQTILSDFAPQIEFHILSDTKHLDLVSSEQTATMINQWLIEMRTE